MVCSPYSVPKLFSYFVSVYGMSWDYWCILLISDKFRRKKSYLIINPRKYFFSNHQRNISLFIKTKKILQSWPKKWSIVSRADIAAQRVIFGVRRGFSCLCLEFVNSSSDSFAYLRGYWDQTLYHLIKNIVGKRKLLDH